MVKNILIPYDGSESAKHACNFAIDLAQKYKAKIVLVMCVYVPPHVDPIMGTAYVEMMKSLKDDAAKTIADLEPELERSAVPYKTEILETISIIDSLVSYAEKNKVDLIVMGSRGLGGFKKLLLGSVASGVSQHSKCPVLIIK